MNNKRLFRLLCVDDNPSILWALKTGLENYGLEVVTACHGIDALMQYRASEGKFDAIITDNDMPKMSGLEFVRSVREIGFTGRIVVISGSLTERDLGAYQNYAISDFLSKPFEISFLAEMLFSSSLHHESLSTSMADS